MTGVRNFEGIEGADTYRRPGLATAALILGEFWLLAIGFITGPETFLVLSKSEIFCSYWPGPTGDP